MKVLFILFAHFLVTVARLARPGGVRAIAAESLAVKHQLLMMKRTQRRCPKLTPWDRVILGFCTLLASPRRVARMAVILKTSTLLGIHRALVKRKHRLLYSPRRRRRPGPKGPTKELIDAVLEMAHLRRRSHESIHFAGGNTVMVCCRLQSRRELEFAIDTILREHLNDRCDQLLRCNRDDIITLTLQDRRNVCSMFRPPGKSI